MAAGKMRHVVNVMRPAAPGDVGIDPTVFRKEVPCSIDNLTGKEAERLQQMYATATSRVKFYGSPDKQVTTTDWLIDQFGKRLNIVQINDPLRNQQGMIELICGEAVA